MCTRTVRTAAVANPICHLEPTAWELMTEEASSKEPNETGGIFFGFWIRRRAEVAVTHVIGPGPKAIHERCLFRPDVEYQEAELERLFYEFDSERTYLGDWHTHPGGSPSLSALDLKTLRKIAWHKPARAPRPLMGVMTEGPGWWLDIWQGSRRLAIPGTQGLAKFEVRIGENPG